MPRVTITIPEKNAQPYRFQLNRKVVTLGRGSENDIVIDCGSVSVKHAEMIRVKGGYELRDLGSTNGIKLYGERREVIKLRSGLEVKLGDVAFDFLLTDDELEALAEEKPAGDDGDDEKSVTDLPPLEDEDETPNRDRDEVGSGSHSGLIVLFIFLALVGVFAGMSVRFEKDTGGSLLEAIKNKGAEVSAPAGEGAEDAEATEGDE